MVDTKVKNIFKIALKFVITKVKIFKNGIKVGSKNAMKNGGHKS